MVHPPHDSHPMPTMCSMHMLWNTQIIDTCVVFSQWHIRSNFQFFLSFLAITALAGLYEYLRIISRDFDRRITAKLSAKRAPSEPSDAEDTALLNALSLPRKHKIPLPPLYRAIRAALYGANVALSFFLMLVFMTYNAYLILAVVLGATVGHYMLGKFIERGGKGLACH